jgi:ribosomal protein L6P/L9E
VCLFIPHKLSYIFLKRKDININYRGVCIWSGRHIMFIMCNKIIKTNNTIILEISNFRLSNRFKYNSFNPISNLLVNWLTTFNFKIKFSGKGYKLIKQSNCFNLYVNTSHKQWFFFFKTISIKLHKQKYLFLNKNYSKLLYVFMNFIKVRPINIFTKRGLRGSKQKILKKVGKRSV